MVDTFSKPLFICCNAAAVDGKTSRWDQEGLTYNLASHEGQACERQTA